MPFFRTENKKPHFVAFARRRNKSRLLFLLDTHNDSAVPHLAIQGLRSTINLLGLPPLFLLPQSKKRKVQKNPKDVITWRPIGLFGGQLDAWRPIGCLAANWMFVGQLDVRRGLFRAPRF